MRQTAGTVNRIWLTVLGIVLFVVGLVGILIATGLGSRLIPQFDTVVSDRAGPVMGERLANFLALSGGAAVLALVGLVLVVLGLAWLGTQVPRKLSAKPYRLHDDPTGGVTTCDPDVIARVVEREAEDLPDVVKAAALLRGTAALPELHVRVTASDQADLTALLERVEREVAGHVAIALDTPIKRLAVELEVDRARRGSDAVTVDARPDAALASGRRQLL